MSSKILYFHTFESSLTFIKHVVTTTLCAMQDNDNKNTLSIFSPFIDLTNIVEIVNIICTYP